MTTKKSPKKESLITIDEKLRRANRLIEAFCSFTGRPPLGSGHAGEVNEAYLRWMEVK